MPSGSLAPHPSKHADMSSGDQSFEKFFEEVIASPELNLLDDVFAEDIDQKPHIHHHPYHPHMPHPILHRLQPVPPPPLSILKAHVLPIHPTPPSSGSGGISPTLTWSGGPSPIDHDQNDSPTLHDAVDLDGEEWKPSSSITSLFPASSSRRNSSGSRGRERVSSTNNNGMGGDHSTRAGTSSHSHSHSQSHSRSRSSQRSVSASSADGGDELTMSALSIQNGTTSLAMISSPSSPGNAAHTPRPGSTPGPRKKSRTTSSSRSSISSIDALISEAMGSGPSNRLVPTGHRRNITSASLVPLDAPTQIRNYLTPSSTSKKDVPSAFVARKNKLRAREATNSLSKGAGSSSSATAGRKRTREEAGLKMESTDENENENEHVDELQDDDTPLDAASPPSSPAVATSATTAAPTSSAAATPTPTGEVASESSSLLSAIEAKRRQNTLAARRSRQRKLDYVRNLEELVAALTKERDSWKGRAENAEKVLGYMPGADDMDEDDDDE